MKKLIFGFLILAFSASFLKAQNTSFSQFDNNPLFVNPGMTGDFEGQLRINSNYRNQWANNSSENNYGLYTWSVDSHLRLADKIELGIGVSGFHNTLRVFDYRIRTYQVSTALHYYLGDKSGNHHKLSLGLDGGQGSRSLGTQFVDCIVPGVYERNVSGRSTTYPLFTTGLMWSYQSASRFSARAGASAYGVNRPTISFNPDSDIRQDLFWTFLGQIELPIGKRFSVTPSGYYVREGLHDQLTFGSFGRFYANSESNHRFVQVGVFGKTTRNNEQELFINEVISLQARIQWDWHSIGYAFDHQTFSGSTANSHEFSLGYRIGNAVK